jgi:arsenite methyltransferase
MKPQPSYTPDDPLLMQIFDELPLWSAPFGQALLDRFQYRSGLTVLDIGCGTGFPSLELAQRLGASGIVIGLDPWKSGIAKASAKAAILQAGNVEFVEGVAESMPFQNEFFDAIVSNNGLNNVADLDRALEECRRVAAPGAQLVMTMNLPDTMREFYTLYEETLQERGCAHLIPKLRDHIHEKRKPRSFLHDRLVKHGFSIRHSEEKSFALRFLDGTALFNHHFIRLGFLGPWMKIVDGAEGEAIFTLLEKKLNQSAAATHGLSLAIPFVCLDAARK